MAPWLVTGAAGFIGYHVCRRLADEGIEVVGTDNLNDYYDPSLKQGRLAQLDGFPTFEFRRLDLRDGDAMADLFREREPDVVVHLAAQAGVRYSLEAPMAYIDSNVVGFMNILERCRHDGVDHLVYASSSSVYGALSRLPFAEHDAADHPVSIYAATKRANELMAHSYSHLFGLPTTGLRFFTVYGPWGRPDMAYFAFAEAILAGAPITVFGDGSALRDFTYVDDIVEGIVRIARRPPTADASWSAAAPDPATSSAPWRVYNIGHGEQVTVNHLIELLEQRLGRAAVRNVAPAQPGDLPATHAATDDLAAATGFTPVVSFDDGIGRFVDWFLDYRGRPRSVSSST